jgi:GNAT superfamily N-acetyltransferase
VVKLKTRTVGIAGIAFDVNQVFDVVAATHEGGGFTLSERAIDIPYTKNYGALDGEGPSQWPTRFDLSHWGVFAPKRTGQRVGGAAVAFRKHALAMLEKCQDLAVLWDIRVAPEARRQGVGSRLIGAVEAWARRRDCGQLKVETQNINLPACRFYARHGFMLRGSAALPTLGCRMRPSCSGTKTSEHTANGQS